jgi:thiamine biosynthesis lipoprotein
MYKFIFAFNIFLTLFINAEEIQRQQLIMGTFATIKLDENHKKEIQKGFNLLKKIEKSLSSYDNSALLYRLNQKKNIIADPFLLKAIKKSKLFYQYTNGYFDISIGSVTKQLYHFGENEQIPNQQALQSATTNIDGIHIEKNLITLNENITLDLGGIGKGFAVDRLANYYREKNITYGVIALSGDNQALHTTALYINSPFEKKTFAKLTTLYPNISISTSGTYRRYIKNKKHHHLINPKNKKQGKAFVSITLITDKNNTLIDAMATAIGVMPYDEAMKFLSKHSNIGYLLVTPNRKIRWGNLKNLAKIEWIHSSIP